jgi:hypothetical protein
MYSTKVRKVIAVLILTLLTVFISACNEQSKKRSNRSTVTSFELIPEQQQPRVITSNPCGQGFSWCEKSQECIRPMALVKGGNIKDMEKLFKETCENRPAFNR